MFFFKKDIYTIYLNALMNMYKNQINLKNIQITKKKYQNDVQSIVNPTIIGNPGYYNQNDPIDIITGFLKEINLANLYDYSELFDYEFNISFNENLKYIILKYNIVKGLINYNSIIPVLENYNLVAVIAHMGKQADYDQQSGGHYNIYVKYDKWYLYDDNNILLIDNFDNIFDFTDKKYDDTDIIHTPEILLYEKK